MKGTNGTFPMVGASRLLKKSVVLSDEAGVIAVVDVEVTDEATRDCQ